eukprot:COSAG01_NODE_2885_length_6901_cov_101.837028_9_plen_55_part_00
MAALNKAYYTELCSEVKTYFNPPPQVCYTTDLMYTYVCHVQYHCHLNGQKSRWR